MNTPIPADILVLVTSALLNEITDEAFRARLRAGDYLTCTPDGRVTGFWRSEL